MMQTLIQKAQKGDVSAMMELFDTNKSKVYFLCRTLLQNEKEADRAAIFVFSRAWEEIADGRIATEEEFCTFVTRRAVTYCKVKVSRQDKRAFRIPANCNFIHMYDAGSMNFHGDLYKIIILNLPVFQRFLYVIHTVAGYSEDELAKLFGIKVKIVKKALDEEAVNVSRIVALTEKYLKMKVNMDADMFHETIRRKASEAPVPEKIKKTVEKDIKNVCLPIQKKQKIKQIRLLAIVCAGIFIVCVVSGGLLSGRNKGSESAGDTLTAEQSDSENSAGAEKSGISEDDTEAEKSSEDTENLSIEATHYADIIIENYGTITVALDGNTAPETVENFVSLAESGFYDGLTFHRIMNGFMMQGGDPNGDGTGGSENTITGEFSDNGIENDLSHTRGAVSMARSSDYNSASSQFFIVHEDSTNLDGQYAVFGYVTDGMDIVDEICNSAEPTDDNGTISPEEQPVITSITVTAVEENDEDAA